VTYKGDQAFTRESYTGTAHELEFAGAASMFRRRYSKSTEGLDGVIFGIPFDLATTYRPGARFGPRSLRAASSSITHGRVWPWNFNPFQHLAVSDWGDVMFDEGSLSSMVESVEQLVSSNGDDVVPIAMGGDHYISLPVLRVLSSRFGALSLVHFDAHSDTWVDARHNHGSVFYHALSEGLISPSSSVHVGVRTFNGDDDGMALLSTPWINRNGERAAALRIAELASGPVYVSFDIDVFDPSFAPGTGTPAPGGLNPYQVKQIIYELAGTPFGRIVGLDLAEVSPAYDVGENTALLGASVLLDLICLLAASRLGRGRPDDEQGGSGVRRQ
jgi:agmatinase